MALAEVYFDESGTHEGSKTVCVAGYIFKKENALLIEREWNWMLADYSVELFHMKECAHNTGRFSHLSKQETIEIATRAINLIKTYAERGIAFSVDIDAFPLIPLFGRPQNPYSFLCTQVMHSVKRWARETEFDGDVSYIYEMGAAGKGLALSFMSEIEAAPQLKREYRLSGVQFLPKDKAVLLQCADMLAWHWNLFRRKTMQGKNPWRADFRSLKEKLIDPHHYDRETVTRWLQSDSDLRHLANKPEPA